MSVNVRSVAFFSGDGVRIAANLYVDEEPDGRSKAPAIVLCQGLSGEKQKVLPGVASSFAASGYVTLAFDYCGCGESEDRRARPYVFPAERVEDALSAIAYVAQLPFVDSGRIGLYSISYGGPVAIHAAAYDRRVRCLAVVSGPGDGPAFLASLMDPHEWELLCEEIEADRSRRAVTGKSALVPLTHIIRFPDSFWARYRRLGSADESESLPEAAGHAPVPMLSLESADAMLRSLPGSVVPLVAPRPILFVHGEEDDVAKPALARELFARAAEPKQFAALPGFDHIGLDTGEGLKQQVALAQQWFDRHLKG
jgi:alpha-beta hydrolase superfamily lysophospholipase